MLFVHIEWCLHYLTGQHNVDVFIHLELLLYGRKIRQLSY